MNLLLCNTLTEWHKWLKANHYKVSEVWLVFLKKDRGEQTLTYDEALDEALCYGWIDSLIRKIDEKKYARKFTPRKEVSIWSTINKNRVERLTKDGRMTRAGLAIVKAAKKNGCWNRGDWIPEPDYIPVELEEALRHNKQARANFEQMAPGYRKQYVMWIATAKRSETRAKRAAEAVCMLERNEKKWMK